MTIYRRHRFRPDIIAHAVWLYYRINLSHRGIEDLSAERFARRLISRRGGEPGKIVTDKLRSDGVAYRELSSAAPTRFWQSPEG